MDIEQLITEIFVRTALWDQKNKNHHNRFILDKLWDEVANKLNTTRPTVRAKWKSLRDKFRMTLASIPKRKSGDEGTSSCAISWKYFESLQFLKDQFTPRESSGNLEKKRDEHTFTQSLEITYDDTEDQDVPTSLDVEDTENRSVSQASAYIFTQNSSFTPNSRGFTDSNSPSISLSPSLTDENIKNLRKRRAPNDVGHELLAIERQKMKIIEAQRSEKADDEDLNFFKSILPHIQHLTPFEKMSYRMKILEVTQEFLKKDTAGSISFTSSSHDVGIHSPTSQNISYQLTSSNVTPQYTTNIGNYSQPSPSGYENRL